MYYCCTRIRTTSEVQLLIMDSKQLIWSIWDKWSKLHGNRSLFKLWGWVTLFTIFFTISMNVMHDDLSARESFSKNNFTQNKFFFVSLFEFSKSKLPVFVLFINCFSYACSPSLVSTPHAIGILCVLDLEVDLCISRYFIK